MADKNNDESLRARVLAIKRFLDAVDGNYWDVGYSPIEDFPDKALYPRDYQIYTEEIGHLGIGSDPDPRRFGYAIMNIATPSSITEINEDKDHDLSLITINYALDDWEVTDQCSFHDCTFNEFKFVAIEPCSALQTFGYCTNSSPFRFVSDEMAYTLKKNLSFLDWLEMSLVNWSEYCGIKLPELGSIKNISN